MVFIPIQNDTMKIHIDTILVNVTDDSLENVFENPYIAMATDDERILFLKAERKLLRLVAGF
jgi:hypothetical protein